MTVIYNIKRIYTLALTLERETVYHDMVCQSDLMHVRIICLAVIVHLPGSDCTVAQYNVTVASGLGGGGGGWRWSVRH